MGQLDLRDNFEKGDQVRGDLEPGGLGSGGDAILSVRKERMDTVILDGEWGGGRQGAGGVDSGVEKILESVG